MPEEQPTKGPSYVAQGDPESWLRVVRRHRRKTWRQHATYYMRSGTGGALIGAGAFACAEVATGIKSSWIGLLLAAFNGFLFGMVLYLCEVDRADKELKVEAASERTVFEIGESGYRGTHESGTFVEYPWSTMSLLNEYPEAWVVKHAAGEIFVFKQPLQEAGLEQAFLDKLAPVSDSDTGDSTGQEKPVS